MNASRDPNAKPHRLSDPQAMPDTPPTRPLNPDFGTGTFRRRIRLQGETGKVIAELEDCNHGFRSVIHHDGETVTAVEPEAMRTPLTTCDGALKPIKALVGIPLTADLRTIFRGVNPRTNCTHLYDLSVLAIHHCLRGQTVRQYDVAIPDEKDHPTDASVSLNGKPLLNWCIEQWVIQNEGALNGLSLGKGFSQWARNLYQGDQREAAFVLQKGYFVSNARRYDMSKLAGLPVVEFQEMSGVCYSYSPSTVEKAVRTHNSWRDFTDTAEQLLKFQ